jgi:hypothetical protein
MSNRNGAGECSVATGLQLPSKSLVDEYRTGVFETRDFLPARAHGQQ